MGPESPGISFLSLDFYVIELNDSTRARITNTGVPATLFTPGFNIACVASSDHALVENRSTLVDSFAGIFVEITVPRLCGSTLGMSDQLAFKRQGGNRVVIDVGAPVATAATGFRLY